MSKEVIGLDLVDDSEDFVFCPTCHIGVDINPESFGYECQCGKFKECPKCDRMVFKNKENPIYICKKCGWMFMGCPKCKSYADVNVYKLSGICKKEECKCELAICPKCKSYSYINEDGVGYTCGNCGNDFAICPKCHGYAGLNNKHTTETPYICRRKKCRPAKCDFKDCKFKNFQPPKDCFIECSPGAKYKHCNSKDCLIDYCINGGCGYRLIPDTMNRLKEKEKIKKRAIYLK